MNLKTLTTILEWKDIGDWIDTEISPTSDHTTGKHGRGDTKIPLLFCPS